MQKKWVIKDVAPAEFLSAQQNTLLGQLLYNRGLTDPQKIDYFLHPHYEKLHDPFSFNDMRKAVDRIWQAIAQKEKIVVYGDYDADGVTATALLAQMFRYLGVTVETYVPDRFSEGYGLNIDAFVEFEKQEVSVVISVDCGTNAIAVAEWCTSHGIDLIITDHHELTGDIPSAFAVINPKNRTDGYPDDQITGVGVAYKLATAILREKLKVIQLKGITEHEFIEHWDKWLLDLVAIGTVADCHSLAGENRTLVYFGLKVMAKTKWVGLQKLLDLVLTENTKNKIDTYTIGFLIAPRINAAGRLEHAQTALQLLLAEDADTAERLANELHAINTRRQEITSRLVSEARELALLQENRKVLIVAHPDWHRGVVGLVAGKLAGDFHKPTIVLEENEQELIGSGRSVGTFDMVAALTHASEFLVKYGGHTQAAGLTVRREVFEQFVKKILEYADTTTFDAENEHMLTIDSALAPEHISLDVVDMLALFEPFGVGNEKPVFTFPQCTVLSTRLVGNGQKHMQMVVRFGSATVQCIGFGLGFLYDTIREGQIVDIAGELLADSWNGMRTVKIRILDIKLV